jgi:hypothetical protein
MSLDGTWHLTVSSPTGDNPATAEFVTDGSTLTGKYMGLGTTEDIVDGVIDGDRVRWSINRTEPIEMTSKFDLGLEGPDAMSGEVEVGTFGAFKISGVRK